MPTPRNKKKKGKDLGTPTSGGGKSAPSPGSSGKKEKAPPVHANYKAMTRLFKDHVAAMRRWLETEDEAKSVVASISSFQSRLPVLERARYDERARSRRPVCKLNRSLGLGSTKSRAPRSELFCP